MLQDQFPARHVDRICSYNWFVSDSDLRLTSHADVNNEYPGALTE